MNIHEYLEDYYKTDPKYRGQKLIIDYVLSRELSHNMKELHLGIGWRDGGFVDTFVAQISENMVWIVLFDTLENKPIEILLPKSYLDNTEPKDLALAFRKPIIKARNANEGDL